MKWKPLLVAVMLATSNPAVAVETCPLSQAPADRLDGPLAGRTVLIRSDPPAVVFFSGLERDDDGAPTAYHRGLVSGEPDTGLDHICNGASVLEVADGVLRNRYPSLGYSKLSDHERHLLSQHCKLDYLAIREAHFLPCAVDQPCMLWFGIMAVQRACGFRKMHEGEPDMRCGTPILQQDANGRDTDFYVTATALTRPGSPKNSTVQGDYVDASAIPYVVVPEGLILPNGEKIVPGDLAIVTRGEVTVYAVVGDTGPSDALGEASRALLRRLGGGSEAPITDEPHATTILLPGTSRDIMTHWPLDPVRIETAGRAALQRAGGVEAFRNCLGLDHLR